MTDDNVVSLGTERAMRDDDCSAWTPRECLEQMIKDIDSGEIDPDQLVVHYLGRLGDGSGSTHHWYAANVTFSQHIALLHVALEAALDEWRGNR